LSDSFGELVDPRHLAFWKQPFCRHSRGSDKGFSIQSKNGH
jgi:hypothetical protein